MLLWLIKVQKYGFNIGAIHAKFRAYYHHRR
jgi:hypothetical protein